MDWTLSTGAARGDFSSPLETGKSTGGGGVEELYSDYAAAAPKVSFGPEVGIVCLPITDIGLPGMICGGLIGNKSRMYPPGKG